MKKLFNLFSDDKDTDSYELVEAKIDEENGMPIHQSGIKIKTGYYAGVIVALSPRVQLVEDNGFLYLKYDFSVEYNPNNVVIEYKELHKYLGDIVLTIIKKDMDYAIRTSDFKHFGEKQ